MKSILILLLGINIVLANNEELSQIRTIFYKAPNSEIACDSLLLLSNNYSEEQNIIKGYKGCYYMIKCQFITSPIKKIQSFNKGKDLLENAIKNDSNNIELAFLRYTIQKNAPKFLLYNNEIDADLALIKENIKDHKDKELKELINRTLKELE